MPIFYQSHVRRCVAYALTVSMMLAGVATRLALAGVCTGNNDAYGPCSDQGVYLTSGVGDGWCGACGDLARVYIGGNCAGGDGEGAYDCNDCETNWKTSLQRYTSTPVGPTMAAACTVGWYSCRAAGGVVVGGCAAACGIACTKGTPLMMAACALACAATCEAGAESFCDCIYAECVEVCEPSGAPVQTGSSPACN
jgi:hypothetical protein